MLGHANAGENLIITKIVVGDGVAADATAIYPLTALISKKLDVVITRKLDQGGGKMVVSGVITEWLQTGAAFQLRELGVMAKIGATGTEKLYCAANVFADPPDTVTPGGTSTHSFDILIEIQRATNVTVVIDESTMMDAENIPSDATVGAGWYAQKVGKIFQFKRAVAGTGIEIIEEPDRATIRAKILDVDLDVYVPLSYPGITDPKLLFPTIQAAHDYLMGYVIPTNRHARINVAAGSFGGGQITFNHPNCQQISLLGWPRQDRAVSRIEYLSPTTKKVTCDTTGLVAGQIAYLADCDAGWSGGCQVNSIGAGYVVCSVLSKSSRPAYALNDLNAGRRLSWLPTIISNNYGLGQHGLWFPFGMNLVQNILMQGGPVHTGFASIGPIWFRNCMAWFCHNGFGVQAPATFYSDCLATWCDTGVMGAGLISTPERFYINACGSGIAPSGATPFLGPFAAGLPGSFTYITHCVYGILAAMVGCQVSHVHFNTNDIGWYALLGGSISNYNQYQCWPYNNGTDLYAASGSFIQYSRVGGPVPTCNPAAGVIGNANSYIEVLA